MIVNTKLLAFTLIGLLCANSAFASAPEHGAAAPVFTLSDQDGKAHSLSDYKGKIVVLEWTNYDCPFVKRHYENGAMQKLAAGLKSKGVVWLAINSTHYATTEADKSWSKKQEISYPVLLDSEGEVGKSYGAKSTPFMTVIDSSGKIAYQGAIDNDPYGEESEVTNYVSDAVAALLASKPIEFASTTSYGCSVKYKS